MRSVLARQATVVVVSVASLLGCLALAWWQWERYESATGTWQNLGYVLQWPLFGLFPAFVFLRMRRLRQQAAEAAEADDAAPAVEPEAPAPPVRPRTVTQPAAEEADDELAAYNRYLAELHARDQQAR